MCLTGCTALSCRFASWPMFARGPGWATGDGAAALPGRRTHVHSFSPKLELDVRGLQVYLCPKKEFADRNGSSGCDAAETPWTPGLRLTELGWLAS